MSELDNIPVVAERPAAVPPQESKSSGLFTRVFDELKDFCRSKSLFMLH
jgi:hypothetical protein